MFINIQLTKKEFGSNIHGHIKKQFWDNEACCFIIFKVITKNPPWKNIKDDISARKGSITYKNFDVWLTKLTHS